MNSSQYAFRNLFLPLFCLCAMSLTSCKKGDQSSSSQEKPKDEIQASQHRLQDEQRAKGYLDRARAEMNAGNYDAAREAIKEMRDSCYLALEARENGILLLDSIDLMHAQTDNSSSDKETRIEFYQKKLEYDIMAKKKHELNETR